MAIGPWKRVIIAAAATVIAYAGVSIAVAAAQGDLKALAKKYPAVAADKDIQNLISGIPIVGGIVSFFAAPVLDKAAESGMSDSDQKAFERDTNIITWAPWIGAAVLIIGIPVSLYLLWTDVIRGQTAEEMLAKRQAAALAGLAAGAGVGGVVAPGTQFASQPAGTLAQSSAEEAAALQSARLAGA
jgi:hypothetical protein